MEYGFLFRELDSPKGARILDVGFADSPSPFILAALGYDVHAIDIMAVDWEYPGVKVYRGDIRATNFSDDYFDAIVAVSAIEHVGLGGRYTSEEDRNGDRIAMDEMRRILKPGGRLLFTAPFGKAKVERPFHCIYNRKQIEELLASFEIVKMEFAKEDSPLLWRPASLLEVENTNGYHACVLVKAVKPS
jgi:SAM-dependent methyltransferase